MSCPFSYEQLPLVEVDADSVVTADGKFDPDAVMVAFTGSLVVFVHAAVYVTSKVQLAPAAKVVPQPLVPLQVPTPLPLDWLRTAEKFVAGIVPVFARVTLLAITVPRPTMPYVSEFGVALTVVVLVAITKLIAALAVGKLCWLAVSDTL
jgi:hypothetical protein